MDTHTQLSPNLQCFSSSSLKVETLNLGRTIGQNVLKINMKNEGTVCKENLINIQGKMLGPSFSRQNIILFHFSVKISAFNRYKIRNSYCF